MSRTFDYDLREVPARIEKFELEGMLMDMGSEGWELCAVTHGFLVFKKENTDA